MAEKKAQQFKDKGNTAFKAAQYVEAIGHYTDAILALPSEPTYFLNRAAAYLKLVKNEDAERDCIAALKLQPSNVKAFYRRAQARVGLARWDDAIQDFKKVLELDPSNLAAQAELQKAQSSKNSADIRRKGSTEPPRRRRVPITVIDPQESISPTTDKVDLNQAQWRKVPISIVETTANSDSTNTPSPPPKAPLKSILKKSENSQRETQSAKVTGGIIRSDGTTRFVSTSTSTARPPVDLSLSNPVKRKIPTARPTPGNWNLAALTRYFSSETDPLQRWLAIQYTLPEKIPSFFAHSLTSSILNDYIETFNSLLEGPSSGALKDHILSYMKWFPSAERFKTIILFLSSKEKESVRKVWKGIGAEKVDDSLRATWGA